MTTQNLNPDVAGFLYQKAAQKAIPLGGNFELTPRCSMNCKMCYIKMTEKEMALAGKERTLDEWLKIADEAKAAGMLFLLLTGGEPLLYPDFWALYDGLKKLGLLISINTNAVLFDDEVIAKFAKNPPYKLNVTLYGSSNETYQRLCGCKDGYTKATRAIEKMKKAGLFVKINGSITPDNEEDINDCFDFAKSMCAPCSLGCYMFPPIRRDNKSSARFEPEQAGKNQAKIDKLRYEKEDYNKQIEKIKAVNQGFCAEDIPFSFRCRAGVSSFWITWKGEMSACGMMDDFFLDPIKEGFLSCWQKINERTKNLHALEGCRGCKNREICKVCPAIARAETNDINGKPEYLCKMIESWKSEMLKNCD